jgi:MoxR-like ATPase
MANKSNTLKDLENWVNKCLERDDKDLPMIKVLMSQLGSQKLDTIRKISRLNGYVKNTCEKKFSSNINKVSKNGLTYLLARNLIVYQGKTVEAAYKELMNSVNSNEELEELLEETPIEKPGAEEIPFEEIPTAKEKKAEQPALTQESDGTMKLNLGIDMGAIISQATHNYINDHKAAIVDKQINEKIEKEIAQLKPTLVTVGDRESIEIKGKQHKSFEESLFLCVQETQLMMVGPAGSGKTTLGEQIAESLKLPFKFISCSAGMSEAHLLGRMVFDGTYVPSDFVRVYENGGVFLFDEIDAADSNTLLVINSALANGYLSVPNRKDNPTANRHKDCIVIVSGNSWGNGSMEYQGRGYLDAAFLDRFCCSKVEVDYDRDLEADISSEYPEVAEQFWTIRDQVKANKLRRVVSTRAIISGVRQIKAGRNINDVLRVFTKDWSNEEKQKAQINV